MEFPFYAEIGKNENASRCKPVEFTANNRRVILALNEDEVIGVACWIGKRRTHPDFDGAFSCPVLFDDLIADVETFLMVDSLDGVGYDELGCSQCPFRAVCLHNFNWYD